MTKEEALNEIRSWAIPSKKGREVLETLIPELAESEDEKMVVKIAQTLSFAAAHNLITDYDELIAMQNWLEKQKESLHISETCKENPNSFTNEDERIRKRLIEYFEGFRMGNAEVKWEGLTVQEVLAWLEKQKEQKPVEHSAKGRRGRMGGIPEYVRRKAEAFKDKMEPPYDADDICSAYETGAMENANSSWSEEDEEMLNSCICSIEESKENRYAYKETDGDTSYDHEIAWLKSLRPVSKESLQPHWKPSEEQMESLAYAIQVLKKCKSVSRSANSI